MNNGRERKQVGESKGGGGGGGREERRDNKRERDTAREREKRRDTEGRKRHKKGENQITREDGEENDEWQRTYRGEGGEGERREGGIVT